MLAACEVKKVRMASPGVADTSGSLKTNFIGPVGIVGHLGAGGVTVPGETFVDREADTVDQLMAEMTTRRFRHMPVVERDRLVGLVSIGDLVKIQIAEIEMEAAATREYTA